MSKSRKSRTVGKLPRRYTFILNPFPDTRLSTCPSCQKLTFARKFPLFIHIDGYGPLALGKTCKYCARCELIMADQFELEVELAHGLEPIAPEAVGNDYLVLGTVEKKQWKAGLARAPGGAGTGHPQALDELLEHTADFKSHSNLRYDPGGWRPAGEGPRYLQPRPLDTPWRQARLRRATPAREGDSPVQLP